MDILIHLTLIAVITTIVIDMTDFITSIKNVIKKYLNIKGNIALKPFDCSLCMTFWLCTIYLLIYNQLSLKYITITLLLAISTEIIQSLIRLAQDIITKLIDILYNKLID